MKYSILCAGMNKVSDINLAIAVHECGVLPTLSVFNYSDLYNELQDDMTTFKSVTNSNEIAISFDADNVIDVDKIIQMQPAYVEVLGYRDKSQIPIFEKLNDSGIKIILKQVYVDDILQIKDVLHMLYGIILKNEKSAGLNFRQSKSLHEQVLLIKEHNENVLIIASGGIYDKADIDKMLNAGADAVSIGTLFALSAESKISEVVKNNIISSKDKLSILSDVKQSYFHNCVVFNKNIRTRYHTDSNYTNFLIEGLNTGKSGLVYMGYAIKRIEKIETVKQIMNRLTGE